MATKIDVLTAATAVAAADQFVIDQSGSVLRATADMVRTLGAGECFKSAVGEDICFKPGGVTTALTLDDATQKATFAGPLDITGNIVVSGTVDGRDVATDGTKLDGIEALADVTDAANVAAAGAFMLAGQSGGQTGIGGTGSGDDLLLQSTSHATKGTVAFGSLTTGLVYDEVNNRLGLGVVPTVTVHIKEDVNNVSRLLVENANTGNNAVPLLEARADVARVFLAAHSSGEDTARFGITLDNWTEILTYGSSEGLAIGLTGAFPLVFGTNSLERARIDSSGNFGLGTTSPQTNFHISESNTDTTPAVEIEQLSTGDAALQFSIAGRAYAMGIDNSDSDKFKVSTAASEGGAVLGTGDALTLTTGGELTVTGDLNVNGNELNVNGLNMWCDSTGMHLGGSIQALARLQINDGAIMMDEIAAPSAPPVQHGVLYLDDNGSGKTRLMVRFNTGAAQQVAIEP